LCAAVALAQALYYVVKLEGAAWHLAHPSRSGDCLINISRSEPVSLDGDNQLRKMAIQESTFRCSYHAKMFVEIPLLSLCSLPEKIICITWSCYIMVYKGERFISCIGTNYKCPDTA